MQSRSQESTAGGEAGLKIVIVGGNAGARIASEIFALSHPKHTVCLLDCFAPAESWKADQPDVLAGAKEDANNIDFLKQKNVSYFVATGDNRMRRDITAFLMKQTGKSPVNCIHPSAIFSSSAALGYGNLICPTAVLHTQTVIGNGTIINTGAVIEHDCIIRDYAQISPNVTLAGYVDIEAFAFVSSAAVVIPHLKIGKGSLVAAGAVVTAAVKPFTMVAGCPAIEKKILEPYV